MVHSVALPVIVDAVLATVAAITVGHPTCEHPKRPVQGFACRRHEVSVQRMVGVGRFAADRAAV